MRHCARAEGEARRLKTTNQIRIALLVNGETICFLETRTTNRVRPDPVSGAVKFADENIRTAAGGQVNRTQCQGARAGSPGDN
jgi:hypothetical protein